MKKLFAILLVVMILASMATVVSAESITTLTTTVPAATYTLNIPADQEITFGISEQSLGTVRVTDTTGFALGKNLSITLTYDAFKCQGVSTTIPFVLYANYMTEQYQSIASGDTLLFYGASDGNVNPPQFTNDFSFYRLKADFDSSDWGKALAGEYTATITFTAEVVSG